MCDCRSCNEGVENAMRDIRDKYTRYGWVMIGVFASNDGPSFMYTIGLEASYNHPDFIIFGMPQQLASSVINTMAHRVIEGERFQANQIDDDLANLPSTFRDVTPDMVKHYCCQATTILQSGAYPEYLQIVWPDTNGKFPWQSGYEECFRDLQMETWSKMH